MVPGLAILDTAPYSVYTLFVLTFSQAARRIAQECSGIRVRQASRLLTRVYDEALRPLGIQASQLSVLIAVALVGENGGNFGAVARVLSMDRTTLTRNLAPLEKAGLLRVSRSPTDARARIVSLTRAGEKQIESAYPRWEQAQKQIRARLGASTFDALRAQLDGVVALASKLDDK